MSTLNVNNINEVGGVDAVVTAGVLDSGSLPAGSILQVVEDTTTTTAANSSSSYVDTTLTASITPSSASNKILVLVAQQFELQGSASNQKGNLQILRDATSIFETAFRIEASPTGGQLTTQQSPSLVKLDSPATTSSVTYKTQMKVRTGSTTMKTQVDSAVSTIILIEVAA